MSIDDDYIRDTDQLIFRAQHTAGFTTLSNAMLGDIRLSWKARGLLAYLLSKPPNWKVIISHLVTQGSDGKAAIVAGLDELEGFGYLKRTRRPKVKGQFDGWFIYVYEIPCKIPDETASDFQHPTASDFPATDNQSLLNTEVQKTDLQKKENELSISDPVDMADVRERRQRIMPDRFKATK